ncbi:hypothetical protein Bp8pS_298 [Bacillus phage vB_BpuM-BpSp]|nr:hypothetical protein Bp8pS_298 [Bacillus phage vB_BpuM-BpSp]
MILPKLSNLKLREEGKKYEHVIESIEDKAELIDIEFLNDEKKYINYVKKVESIVRTSMEYKSYIGFLKNELDLNKCTFLPQVDMNEIKSVGLEMHHYPFTLFDIVNIVCEKRLLTPANLNPILMLDITPFDIAEEVMKLHYMNYIGLVPITKTIHELAHSGKVFINLKYVFGNYEKFSQLYENEINIHYKDVLENLKLLSKKEDLEGTLNGDILDRKMLVLNIKDLDKTEAIKIEEEKLA